MTDLKDMDKPSREMPMANVDSLRDIAIFLEGYKLGKGNILPLGTILIDDLWTVINELNWNGVIKAKTKKNELR